MSKRFCKNTDVVRAGGSRHSYKYGQEWFEFEWWHKMSICTMGVCGAADLNAWVAAAGGFITGQFRRQYEITKTTLGKKQGGLLTDQQKIVLQDTKRLMNEWDEKYGDYTPEGAWEEFKSGWGLFSGAGTISNMYRDKITDVIDIFDQASCAMDELNFLQPEGTSTSKPPLVGQGPPLGATSWMGMGDDTDSGGGPGFGTLAMVFGIGIAGFIGYKAMTE